MSDIGTILHLKMCNCISDKYIGLGCCWRDGKLVVQVLNCTRDTKEGIGISSHIRPTHIHTESRWILITTRQFLQMTCILIMELNISNIYLSEKNHRLIIYNTNFIFSVNCDSLFVQSLDEIAHLLVIELHILYKEQHHRWCSRT